MTLRFSDVVNHRQQSEEERALPDSSVAAVAPAARAHALPLPCGTVASLAVTLLHSQPLFVVVVILVIPYTCSHCLVTSRGNASCHIQVHVQILRAGPY
jgi:hypothetical protein